MKDCATVVLVVVLLLGVFGCGQKKEGDEPTKYADQSELAKMSEQAAQKPVAPKPASQVNPQFGFARDIEPASKALKDLDSVIRPVLVQQFDGAKIIEQDNEPSVPREDDVLLNSMVYVVAQRMNEPNVRALHTALSKEKFKGNIRLGTKPTVTKSWAAMSFYKYVSGIQYSIVFRIDFVKQKIKVESYKPGSKYERMM